MVKSQIKTLTKINQTMNWTNLEFLPATYMHTRTSFNNVKTLIGVGYTSRSGECY